jgi:peroxiredoxin
LQFIQSETEKIMTIKIGDKIPSVTLKHMTADGMQDISTDSVFANKKVVMFAVPGAYTPTCTAKHLPSYLNNMAEFTSRGITVVCMAVNDPFVMKHWAEEHKATAITMLPDGSAVFSKAMGLDMDASSYGMGIRSQRFALYAENGVVKSIAVEQPGKFEVSSGEAMLKTIGGMKAAA